MIRSLYIVFIFTLLYFFVFFQIIKVVHSFYLLGNKLTVTVSISIQFSLPPQLEKVNEAVNTLPFQFNKFYAIVNKLLPLLFSRCTKITVKVWHLHGNNHYDNSCYSNRSTVVWDHVKVYSTSNIKHCTFCTLLFSEIKKQPLTCTLDENRSRRIQHNIFK